MYRAAKFYRRHMLGVNVAVLLVVVGVGFVTSTILQSRELARALNIAEQEQAKSQQVTSFLIELLTETDPDVAQGETVTVREALDRGAEKIETELDAQPETKLVILLQMANIYRQLGLYERATSIIEQAQTTSQSLGDESAAVIGQMYLILGNLHHDQGGYELAQTAYEAGLPYLRQAHNDHENLNALLDDLGELMTDMGNYEEAESYLQEALAMSRRMFSGDSVYTASALQSLGYAYLQMGNLPASRAIVR